LNDIFLVAGIGKNNQSLFSVNSTKNKGEWHYVQSPENLINFLSSNKPKYIFFIHWRWIVPSSIVKNYNCVCFHMTDLPYGRGGSPLQNLIIRGHKNTVLTAFKMNEGIDSGPIYLKMPLSLFGKAEDIYKRAAELSWKMISKIIEGNIDTKEQVGDTIVFQRRQPYESELPKLDSIEKIYDFIRMLDAPDYPNAFIETENYKFFFNEAKIVEGELKANVTISLKGR